MARKKITTKQNEQRKEHAKRSSERLLNGETLSDIPMSYAKNKFLLDRMDKGNSKATIDFYKRFFIKYDRFLEAAGLNADCSVSYLNVEGMRQAFIASLGDVNQQTINSYLRGYRAFGNYCLESGLIDSFSCQVKEVEPPIKQVYTEKEIKRLLVKPDINYFQGFRNYAIICLLLTTGARANSIINIKIEDVDLDEGYISLNTTKAHKTARIGLNRKCKAVLAEYILRWRNSNDSENDIEDSDYLFCNEYGEQLTRGGLSSAIASYNRAHGVEKTSLHLFRHTFAKNWITSGGDIISLSKVLTHSELDMVKRYSNLYGQDVKEEVEEHSILSNIKTNSGETIQTKQKK